MDSRSTCVHCRRMARILSSYSKRRRSRASSANQSVLHLLLVLMLLTVWFSTVSTTTAQQRDANLLMLGNSYTQNNDLIGMIRSMLAESEVFDVEGSTFERSTPGGYFLSRHYRDATTEGSFLNPLLDGTISWNWIVLQEQSQAGGSLTERNLQWAVDLYTVVQEATDQVVFMMTWGRRNGDPANINAYADFLSMNARLETGYRRYVSATSLQEPASIFAPVGLAFQYIYETDLQERGTDPANDSSSMFYQLYNSDGSHPSVYGSYLAACVLYQVMTELDPRRLSYAPSSIDGDTRNFLQRSAYATVVAESNPAQSPPPRTPAPSSPQPSPEPTRKPTPEPTPEPTPQPTIAPNPKPSSKPSPTPATQLPTSIPSVSPITSQPSTQNISNATDVPSATPTALTAPSSNPNAESSTTTPALPTNETETVEPTSSVPPSSLPSTTPVDNPQQDTPSPSIVITEQPTPSPVEENSGSIFPVTGGYLFLLLGPSRIIFCWFH